MSENQTLTYVTFRIVGELLEPSKVTELLDIMPDKSYKVGDPIERTTPVPQFYNHTEWSIRSQVKPEMELLVHIGDLLQKLLPQAETIMELSKGYKVEFYCSIFADSDKPQIILSSDVLTGISRLGATVTINAYCDK